MRNLCICTEHPCILTAGFEMHSSARSSISDPTLDLIAKLELHPIELCIGVILLVYSIAVDVLAKSIYRIKDESPVSRFDSYIMSLSLLVLLLQAFQLIILINFRGISRSPDHNFRNVHEPFRKHYFHAYDDRRGWGMQKLRMHYLREGNPNATEVHEYENNFAHHFCSDQYNQSQLSSY